MALEKDITDSLMAVTILAGVFGEEVKLHLKSDGRIQHKVAATHDDRCKTSACLKHYTLRLVDADGLALPGELDKERLNDYVLPALNEIDRAFGMFQKRCIEAAMPAFNEYIDDRLSSHYVPQVGDVVKMYDSLGPHKPASNIAFVAALLTNEHARDIAHVEKRWVRSDIVLVTYRDGEVNCYTHNSQMYTKIGVSSDYGIPAARLTDLANKYYPINGRYGKFRPDTGRLAGPE